MSAVPDPAVSASVVAVARDEGHRFTKPVVDRISLRAGLGVEGDAHYGVTVQHRSRVARDPSEPNLRQVHLVGVELLDRLVAEGFDVVAGSIGENVTTRGIDLLGLPTGTLLRLGADAVVEVTGLRNPCLQLNRYGRGLQKAVLSRTDDGGLVRLAGVMAVVRSDGVIMQGDPITVTMPSGERLPLVPV